MAQPDDEDPLLKRRVWKLPHVNDKSAASSEEAAATVLFKIPAQPLPAAAVPENERYPDDPLDATNLFET